jgi:hypothetical protein
MNFLASKIDVKYSNLLSYMQMDLKCWSQAAGDGTRSGDSSHPLLLGWLSMAYLWRNSHGPTACIAFFEH